MTRKRMFEIRKAANDLRKEIARNLDTWIEVKGFSALMAYVESKKKSFCNNGQEARYYDICFHSGSMNEHRKFVRWNNRFWKNVDARKKVDYVS